MTCAALGEYNGENNFRAGALFFTGKENGASAAGKLSPKERERLQSLCGIAKTHLHKSKRKDAP